MGAESLSELQVPLPIKNVLRHGSLSIFHLIHRSLSGPIVTAEVMNVYFLV
jgi:hypothetical protein